MMHNPILTLQFLTRHPLTRHRPLAALGRFCKWQIEARRERDVIIPWVEGTKLAARRGMTGATGNIYCGLHEFSEMAFVLHFLRKDDAFLDVGANIGSFSVLASGVAGAQTWAFEPDPITLAHLTRNVEINELQEKVVIVPYALGEDDRDISFTVGLDTVNRVANEGDSRTRIVHQTSLDSIHVDAALRMIKLDAEGYESSILRGARETLAVSSLKAVQTECTSIDVVSILEGEGFSRYFYDPFTRSLSQKPSQRRDNNALFLRDSGFVSERLRSARAVNVLGHWL